MQTAAGFLRMLFQQDSAALSQPKWFAEAIPFVNVTLVSAPSRSRAVVRFL